MANDTDYVLKNSDKNVVDNLRHKFSDLLTGYSDEKIAEEYGHFSTSDYYGNNDERFIEWLHG